MYLKKAKTTSNLKRREYIAWVMWSHPQYDVLCLCICISIAIFGFCICVNFEE
jgi:hypothetical protein